MLTCRLVAIADGLIQGSPTKTVLFLHLCTVLQEFVYDGCVYVVSVYVCECACGCRYELCVHAHVCVGVGVSYVCYCVSSTQASLFDS